MYKTLGLNLSGYNIERIVECGRTTKRTGVMILFVLKMPHDTV